MRMLTLGSVVLAVVNIAVMWGMAHRWRYAWHGNLGLQLLWLPYDFVTKQYGLLALGAVMTVVSIKGCLHGSKAQPDSAVRGRSRHRRPRRGWFGRRAERTGAVGRANPPAPSPAPARSRRVAGAGTPARVAYESTTATATLDRRGDRRRQLHAGLAHRRKQAIHYEGDRHRWRKARDGGSRGGLNHHTAASPVAHGNVPARVGDEC
jgi:hypothetical protein